MLLSFVNTCPNERRSKNRNSFNAYNFWYGIGGWMSGLIFDITGDYQGAFINGILWNFFNIGILAWLFLTIGKLKVFKK